MKWLILVIVASLFLTSCSSMDELKDTADKAKEAIGNELPGVVDSAKDALKNAGDVVNRVKTYVYNSIGYDKITQYEKSIKEQAVVQIPVQNNTATISLMSLGDTVEIANLLKAQYTDEYNESMNEEQVKEIETTATVELTGTKDNTLLRLARDLASAELNNLVFRVGKVEIQFSPQLLEDEFKNSGSVNVAIKDTGSSYNITFENDNGDEIKLLNNVTISIEANRLKNNSVIYNLQEGIKNLIGGKVKDGKLTFQIKFGGDFSVGNNTADFKDIKGEDKESREAIESLAVKGIFSTETGKFNPNGTVTRAEAVMMITKTLYKYDEDFMVDFDDVSEDEWFYTAVASGVAEEIVKGYPDNTFRPSNMISKQELLTIAASTLISGRKFLLPDDPKDYLGDFEEEIAEWARPYVAMTIRDGIIEQDYAVEGNGEITRAEAALILYNLFGKL